MRTLSTLERPQVIQPTSPNRYHLLSHALSPIEAVEAACVQLCSAMQHIDSLRPRNPIPSGQTKAQAPQSIIEAQTLALAIETSLASNTRQQLNADTFPRTPVPAHGIGSESLAYELP